MTQASDLIPELRPEHLRRINVVGVSGSGKSTLARQLACALGSPHIEMDAIYWGPEWTETADPEYREKIRAALQPDRWVLDGNYHSKTYDIKWARATAIVWVDLPFARTLWQAIGRATSRAWTQQELWAGTGNRESFRRSFFSTESVVLWTIQSYRRVRRRYRELLEDPEPGNAQPFRLTSRRQLHAFVERAEALAPLIPAASSGSGN